MEATPTQIDLFDVRGRVAVITGASSGLGDQFARSLHAAGACVVLGARRVDRLDALVSQLGDGIAVGCDIREPGNRQRLIQAAITAHGRIDILVNNAGIAHSGPAIEETPDQIRNTMETNFFAAFALCQLVAPIMARQAKGGSIVNISSLSFSRSLDRFGLASYAASKAALVALTRELAAQWGHDGIRVNAIAPAWLPSELSGWLEDDDLVTWISDRNALGRPGRRDELDGTLRYLVSDASSYITGQTVVADGGWASY